MLKYQYIHTECLHRDGLETVQTNLIKSGTIKYTHIAVKSSSCKYTHMPVYLGKFTSIGALHSIISHIMKPISSHSEDGSIHNGY